MNRSEILKSRLIKYMSNSTYYYTYAAKNYIEMCRKCHVMPIPIARKYVSLQCVILLYKNG